MLGIKNYNPKMYSNPFNIIEDHRKNLEALIGRNVKEILVVWEQDEDKWFNDCPVIICFEDCQLELCAYQTDKYAVTFDKILVSQDLSWYGTDLKLIWKKNKLEELNFAIDKTVIGIEIIERSETNSSDYYLAGIGFHLKDSYFAICNGLDENLVIKKREEGSNFKHTTI